MSERIDIGHGVTIEIRRIEGAQSGVAYWHPTVNQPGKTCEDWANFNEYGWTNGWDVEQLEPLTISPSLACRACGHHGFIREGKWVPA